MRSEDVLGGHHEIFNNDETLRRSTYIKQYTAVFVAVLVDSQGQKVRNGVSLTRHSGIGGVH